MRDRDRDWDLTFGGKTACSKTGLHEKIVTEDWNSEIPSWVNLARKKWVKRENAERTIPTKPTHFILDFITISPFPFIAPLNLSPHKEEGAEQWKSGVSEARQKEKGQWGEQNCTRKADQARAYSFSWVHWFRTLREIPHDFGQDEVIKDGALTSSRRLYLFAFKTSKLGDHMIPNPFSFFLPHGWMDNFVVMAL